MPAPVFEDTISQHCHFSYAGKRELVKSNEGTKFRRTHICLHSQAAVYTLILKEAMTANGFARLRYAMITSVQKLTQVIKSNTTEFLRIHKYNRKILKRMLKRPLK